MESRAVIVYGDHPNPRPARRMLEELIERSAHSPRDLLIELGQLQQAVLDREWRRRGLEDDVGPLELAFARASRAVALKLAGRTDDVDEVLRALRPYVPDETLEMKSPEGYAYYALYPELFLAAARRWREDHPDAAVRVIGLRSIGTGLAAAVAAGLERDDGPQILPITVRPTGDVFARQPRIAPRLTEHLLNDAAHVHYALVDEGPGLSGSSLGGLADWLEDQGVPPEHLHVFCSHLNPLGPRASARHRARWARIDRRVLTLDDALGPRARIEDISGGAWRAHLYPAESAWPAVWRARESRKFLLRRDGRAVGFAKFNGLGAPARAKLGLARALGDAGFAPRVRRVFNGFVISEWLNHARPLPLVDVPREVVLGRLRDYLRYRAQHARVDAVSHAPAELALMIRRNADGILSESTLGDLDQMARAAASHPYPIYVDGRLHQWEWVVTADGRLLKTDAVDHGGAHDCVGAQDVAWDLAGAEYEFGLDAEEFAGLRADLARHLPPGTLALEKLRFFRFAYLSFHHGYYAMAADQAADDPAEHARLHARAELYAQRLRTFA